MGKYSLRPQDNGNNDGKLKNQYDTGRRTACCLIRYCCGHHNGVCVWWFDGNQRPAEDIQSSCFATGAYYSRGTSDMGLGGPRGIILRFGHTRCALNRIFLPTIINVRKKKTKKHCPSRYFSKAQEHRTIRVWRATNRKPNASEIMTNYYSLCISLSIPQIDLQNACRIVPSVSVVRFRIFGLVNTIRIVSLILRMIRFISCPGPGSSLRHATPFVINADRPWKSEMSAIALYG